MKNLFILFFIFPFFTLAQTKNHYKIYDKASQFSKQKDFEKAKTLCLKLIKNTSGWDDPHLLLSSIYEKEGDVEQAVIYLLNVYSIDRIQDYQGIKKIGSLYYEYGFYQEALFYLEKSSDNYLKLDPTNQSHKQLCRFKNKFTNRWIVKDIKVIISHCNFALNAIRNPVDFNPMNMGSNINSSFAEYLPAISTKGDLLIVTRRIEEEGGDNEDFFVSSRRKDSTWSKLISLGRPFNSPLNEGALAYSADKNLVIYTACNRRDGFGSCDLYFSSSDFSWKEVLNVGSNINSKHWESQACFSPDGKYLYFVSNRPGGYGGRDIWVSEISDKGFGKAYNLGPKINTKYDEMSPFIHADNLTFYFASNGHIGMGDYDLFVSRREDTQKFWQKPKNLGYPINTYLIENSLIVSSNGRTAYYASDKSGFGKEDIFSFELPNNIRANEVSEFELDIITRKAGEEIILKNVHFSHNSFVIDEKSFKELDNLLVYLDKNPSIKILIEGHTDNIGNPAHNKLLSENRAKAVYNYLIDNQIESNRLSYQGHGESSPIYENSTQEGRAKNRRTSFIVIQ